MQEKEAAEEEEMDVAQNQDRVKEEIRYKEK